MSNYSAGDRYPDGSFKANATTPCPRCGKPGMTPRVVMQARELSDGAVAGMQTKLSARLIPVLEHECGLRVVGTVDPDGRHATFSVAAVERAANDPHPTPESEDDR